MRRHRTAYRNALRATSCLVPVLLAAPATARPQDGRVVAGSATIATGTQSTTITQTSPSAIIDWRTFNIPTGHSATFVQPDASSTVLNRVTGREGPSQIHGSLSANGRVFIINPDGILFGAGARVNVGGLVASTHDISNQDFMAGRYRFSIPGNPSASVVNEGTITATSGGFAALVAPGVRNSGVISARLGTVALAAGNSFTLDFYGDQLLSLKVAGDIPGEVKDVATGGVMPANVQNTGKLKANGGTVQMTAATARKVVDSVINNSGVIEANSVRQKGGTIILGAETQQTKSAGAPAQVVKVSGKLSAAGKRAGNKGGEIRVTGEQVALASATLDASGKAGGGTVLVGGDIQGGKPKTPVSHAKAVLSAGSMATADTVVIDSVSTIDVSARSNGDAGKLIVWSDRETIANGTLLAKGGADAGNGGFIEVSSRGGLSFSGLNAVLTAANGASGTILFDPTNLIIGTGEAAGIVTQLNQGANAVFSADEDIRVSADIVKTSGGAASLSLFAGRAIYIGAGVTIGSSSGALNLRLEANRNSGATARISDALTAAADANLGAGGASLVGQPISALIGANPDIANADVFISPSARIYLNGGTIQSWGSNYIISRQISASTPGSLPADSVISSIADCAFFVAQTCGFSYDSDATSYRILSYHVERRQTALPAGVLQSGPAPITTPQIKPVDEPKKIQEIVQSIQTTTRAVGRIPAKAASIISQILNIKYVVDNYNKLRENPDDSRSRVNFVEGAISIPLSISRAERATNAAAEQYVKYVSKPGIEWALRGPVLGDLLSNAKRQEALVKLQQLEIDKGR